jgi:hypothetical protein
MILNKLILRFFLAFLLLFPSFGLAEMKVFEKEVEEIVGRDQSQEQVEAFALQKARTILLTGPGFPGGIKKNYWDWKCRYQVPRTPSWPN